MEDTTTNYSTIIISILMAVVIIATVMMPIITATTQTTTTTEIDNEGEGWLKLGYNQGNNFDFEITNEGSNIVIGDQTGEMGDNIFYADSKNVIFADSDKNAIFLINTDSSYVYKFSNTVSVENIEGTLNIFDGTETVVSSDSPTWAYIPDANGVYGFFTEGGLNLEEDKPKVAVGSYAEVFAYNDTVFAPNDLGSLGLVKSGDYEDGAVIWIVPDQDSRDQNTEISLNANYEAGSNIGFDGENNISLMSADPTTGTQVGDLFYTFSGNNATVVGYSSSIDWTTFTTIPDTVSYNDNTYTVISIGSNAFQNCTNLALTSLPDGLRSIGTYAFIGCTNLALTSLPSGLTSIESYTFRDCTNLALTSLPSGVTSIGTDAFYKCTNLALTSLPSGVTSIGGSAFHDCTNLSLTSLPSGVKRIDSYTFQYCTNLSLTSLPSGVMNIGRGAFSGCTSLALTSLPDGVTSIDRDAFRSCTNLALTSLPSGVTSIGDSAFRSCTSLALTSLPDGVTSIGADAFNGCTSLALTSLPSRVTSIGDSAFQYCTHLSLTSFSSGITRVGNSVFSGCTNLALTSLPSGVKSIGTYAFFNCTNLALTSLPSGLTFIDDYAFRNCTNLALTSLPSGLTVIGTDAFQSCTNLESLIIESSPIIKSNAFQGCTNLKQILNLGDTEITTTSYGLHADSVQDYIGALGYVAPASIHETIIVEDTSLSATLLKLLPVFMALAVVIFIGYAMLRPDSEFVQSLKNRL